nr:flagellar filament capping protein FliD [uncultured Desulfuromonas sp.]
MSTITFSGLATGLDTDSIIESLMEIERAPIDALEEDIEYLEAQNETFESFDTILSELYSAIGALDSVSEFNSLSASTSSDSYVKATASSYTKAGTYQVEVVSLAQQQKDVSEEGFASSSEENLSGTITIGDTTLTYEDASLSSLVDVINDADLGVSASIVDDGTEDGLRLVLTADDAETTPEIYAEGSITIDTATNGHTQDGSMAHVVVDGLDIYSSTNTITSAIYGVTLDLVGVNDSGETTYVQVAADTSSIEENVSSFVTAYNEMINFIDEIGEADSTTAGEFRGVERKMQNLVATMVGGDSVYNSLAALGFETDYLTGEISYDSTTLNDALANNLSDLQALFVGDDDTPGIAVQISNYLDELTDSSDGFVATKVENNEDKIDGMEDQIETYEARLEKREETLTAQFTALETLVSELNSQADYLESFFEDYNSDS